MMVMVGDALFGPGHGRTFMLIEAITVFLALIGTTLSCINTGARVTYAMGKDKEVPEHFGLLHDKNLSPHRAIWTLAIISAVIGCIASANAVRRRAAHLSDATIQALPHGFWSSFGYMTHDKMAALPNTLTHHDAGLELRHVPAVYAELHHLHRLLSRAPEFQLPQAPAHSHLRRGRKPGLHGVLLIGPFMGYGTKMEPFLRLGNRGGLGHLRRHLLRAKQQEAREDDAGHDARLIVNVSTNRKGRAGRFGPPFLWRIAEEAPVNKRGIHSACEAAERAIQNIYPAYSNVASERRAVGRIICLWG